MIVYVHIGRGFKNTQEVVDLPYFIGSPSSGLPGKNITKTPSFGPAKAQKTGGPSVGSVVAQTGLGQGPHRCGLASPKLEGLDGFFPDIQKEPT